MGVLSDLVLADDAQTVAQSQVPSRDLGGIDIRCPYR